MSEAFTSIYDPRIFSALQVQLVKTEQALIKKRGYQKTWVTILTNDLPATERFRIQRKGCEPATIEVSYDYMLSCQSRKLTEMEKRVAQFNLSFVDAIRNAIMMSNHNAFVTPQEAKRISEEGKKVKLAELRDTRGILPEGNFSVKYIAVVTENVTGEQRRIGIPQSSELPTLYDMVREAKRKLTEQILADDSLAAMVKLTLPVPEAVPTQVVISASNGTITVDTSFKPLPE